MSPQTIQPDVLYVVVINKYTTCVQRTDTNSQLERKINFSKCKNEWYKLSNFLYFKRKTNQIKDHKAGEAILQG